MLDVAATLERHLTDWQSGWNIGSFGAIAEFHQDDGERPEVAEPLVRATTRGGIRIERIDGVVPVAWEALSKNPQRWQQGVALCLPEAEATRPARAVMTELGPDAEAIRPEDRNAVLFDMGLGQRNVDFCIRTAEPALLALLREWVDQPLSALGNPSMGAILAAHPHRVALSALGRCEVYQKIGGPDTGGKSPPGPHTHVLPKLMAAGRTHSANVPIPEGLTPALNLHPGSPVMGPLGEDRSFDKTLFDAFQRILETWGCQGYMDTKHRIWSALDQDAAPENDAAATTRLERVARRNALRQALRVHGISPALAKWIETHDRGHVAADEDMPGHDA